jgi:hypothetical protein
MIFVTAPSRFPGPLPSRDLESARRPGEELLDRAAIVGPMKRVT